MIDLALEYVHSGLCVLPAIRAEKRPALATWTPYQRRLPSGDELQAWFADAEGMCVLTGAVSGNLELLDFDHGAERYDAWRELVEAEASGLVDLLLHARSQSGGRHVLYRCETPIPGNRRLAQRTISAANGEAIEIGGKQFVPRRIENDDKLDYVYGVTMTLIETRGEGGLAMCHPTPGYDILQGSFTALPVLPAAERGILVEAALALNETVPRPKKPTTTREEAAMWRPGDDFNERGDVRRTLLAHGWALARGGNNEYWRRPGKQQGWSATLRENVFYVFSSNAAPFEPDQAYSPFSVFAMLEYDGDFTATASALREQGYGQSTIDAAVDLSGLIAPFQVARVAEASPESADPGPLPDELYRVPGFISEVADLCLETAPYPNVALAFCGALALQAVLAGRKVRDRADNRTNLYLLALAFSAVGKDWPRKVNTEIMHQIGQIDALGDKFASGEGIQDALFARPAMLFQTDELDGILQSINKSQDARHENMMGTLLTMYSAANSLYPMRRRAGAELTDVIDQPCLVLFGTAIPTHYYNALSERLLTNGLFARMIIVESGPRSVGQEPAIIQAPERVLKTARWWTEFSPGAGNMEKFHPQPRIVEADEDARQLLVEVRQATEAHYTEAERRGDPVATTVWGRTPEQIRKLALLYAISVNHAAPQIDLAAARWASAFGMHHTRRMLYMAEHYVAENEFHRDALRLLAKLRQAPDQQLAHSVLLKRMKMEAREFQALIHTLAQQGDIVAIEHSTEGRPSRVYRLVGGKSNG